MKPSTRGSPSTEGTFAERAPLGIALSGGGVRASLFCLGALTYLVDSRNSERVREISSVSGGSITNAFVAQRCDFQAVLSEQFDLVVGQLAKAITSGLVSKRFLIETYGALAGLIVVATSISASQRPFALPHWLAAVLIAGFGVLLLLRGVVLTWLFQRRLFGFSGVPTTLGSITSKVNHVLCATDLNASMPVYFATGGMHFYSPAWGNADPEKAGSILIANAVRASAAFPGGIPPMRMDAGELGVQLTPFQQLDQLLRLIFRDVGDKVPTLYLADGGVWNNLGTDWFAPERFKTQTLTDPLPPPPPELLVVDASAPAMAEPRLFGFRIPYLAELLALGRSFLVSNVSTVSARMDRLRESGTFLARITEATKEGADGRNLVWIGKPDHWSGRWTAWLMLKQLFRLRIPSREVVVRNFGRLNEWTASVPTTLFRLPPEVAVQLLVHGYLAVREAMGDAKPLSLGELVTRFSALVGLQSHGLERLNATFLGPRAVFERWERRLEVGVPGVGFINDSSRGAKMLEVALRSVDQQRVATEKVLEEGQQLDREVGRTLVRMDLSSAAFASFQGRHAEALKRFSRILSGVDLRDEMVDWRVATYYALSLAHTRDAEAGEVIRVAEGKLESAAPLLKSNAAAFGWWKVAEVHALMQDVDGAVRCLRRAFGTDPNTIGWLASPKDADVFSQIRQSPSFVALEKEVRGRSQESAHTTSSRGTADRSAEERP